MPSANKTQSGRSVSLNHKELEYTAEIGLVEDIMTSIKLLPGVGYTGIFNALPSIRGGMPGDLKASVDGFYLDNPYHWGGGYSIFDPKTIETAQLYHGVFSARYTHTTSGLLELTSKHLSPDRVDFGLNLSTSAAGFNIAHPLPDFSNSSGANRGAVMLIGKITYWDAFVYLAKELSKSIPVLTPINAVSVAPYIRSLNLLSNYRFSNDMELNLNAYFGSDGIGLLYDNNTSIDVLSDSELKFAWDNLICFFTSNLLFNPRPDMILKTNLGVSYSSQMMNSDLTYKVMQGTTPVNTTDIEKNENKTVGLQGRFDFDWDLENGFLFSAGIDELYRQWIQTIDTNDTIDAKYQGSDEYSSFLRVYPDINNRGVFSGLYSLLEYKPPGGNYAAEAGLRFDHFYLIGKNFTLQSVPVISPRLNFDYYLLRDHAYIDRLTLAVGAGLFSSINERIAYIDKSYGLNDFDLKQNRAATGVTGIKLDFLGNWTFTLEFYYKYIFDNVYTTNVADENGNAVLSYNFDGEGHIYGFDLMLQKINGRLIDGWISYSFNYARYHDPKSLEAFSGAPFEDRTNNWYYPLFHRFSNLNLILNFKPARNFNIYTRFGFASGTPKSKSSEAIKYTITENGNEVTKYKRSSSYSDTERSSFSLPLDVKFSWFFFYPNSKTRTEVYIAVENALSLIYRPKGSTTLNPYTGEEEEGSNTANFELPIPMVSFGFKWTY
jgi:hypothetical protein